jgi:transcriptional regulator with XRE-family HTH domain
MPKPKHLSQPSPDRPMHARDLARVELSRRLSSLLLDRDMNQSDLARASGVPREQISAYVRGRSFPTPLSLKRISVALGLDVTALLPETEALVHEDDVPSFQIVQLSGRPGIAMLKVFQAVTMDQALRIAAILAEKREPIEKREPKP